MEHLGASADADRAATPSEPSQEVSGKAGIPCAVADKLREAKALIERGWCRNNQALDANGRDVDPRSPEAVSFCIYGALNAADVPDVGYQFLKVAAGERLLANWNDAQKSSAPVVEAFRKAIALSEQVSA